MAGRSVAAFSSRPAARKGAVGVTDQVGGTNWSDREIDLIVAHYFDMLTRELTGQHYIKLNYNRALQELTGRSAGSIERKHQNISAVLKRLGREWILGYKPLANYQNALIDGIDRYLGMNRELDLGPAAELPSAVAEPKDLWIGPPPAPSEQDRVETPALHRLILKYDPAERDARNRKLGLQGEELVFQHEKRRLRSAGRDDLARKVEWTSQIRGDGAGYDIRSFEPDGGERLLEVKTTNGAALTPFFLSENERAVSEQRSHAFRLLRLYSFARNPAGFELAPPLSQHLLLSPTNYRATISRFR